MIKGTNGAVLDNLFQQASILSDSSGRDFVIYDLNKRTKNRKITIQYLDNSELVDMHKTTVLTWFNKSKQECPLLRAAKQCTFCDDSTIADRRTKLYKKWKKLEEKLIMYNPEKDFYSNPTDYIDADWLIFSKFKSWLLSQPNYEFLQMRGQTILGKRIFDPDTAVYLSSAPEEPSNKDLDFTQSVHSSRIEESEKMFSIKSPDDYLDVDISCESPETYIVYMAHWKGKIIYVGSGKRDRPKHLNSGSSHNSLLNALKFKLGEIPYKVIYIAKDKEDSLRKERDFIEECKPLCNRQTGSNNLSDGVAKRIIHSL